MKRIITALVLAPLITWVVIWAPFLVFAAVLSVIAALCYWEFSDIANGHGIDIPRIPGIVAGVALLFAPSDLTFAVLLAIAALLTGLRSADLREALPRAGVLLLGMIYIFGCWHTGVALRALNPFWMFFALALNWVGDTAAMYGGRTFGRHKLAPRVSPAKSWEGSIASILGSMLFGVVYAHWALPEAPLWMILAAAVLGNIAGQVGDLCESAFKRGAGMKDSGTLLPGHGGWLDRVDSSLFSVPAVYALVRLWQ
jgi:phosphatidate cytidylyltransferase